MSNFVSSTVEVIMNKIVLWIHVGVDDWTVESEITANSLLYSSSRGCQLGVRQAVKNQLHAERSLLKATIIQYAHLIVHT